MLLGPQALLLRLTKAQIPELISSVATRITILFFLILLGMMPKALAQTPGDIYTIAGNGTTGYGGDGGSAINAELYLPRKIAVDATGNVYLIDNYQYAPRIRKVDAATHTISTVAGTGVSGYNGDNISAVTAELNQPRGLAFDNSGNLFIADSGNSRIRKVDASTGIITTVAITNAQNSIALDSSGNFFYGYQCTVFKVDSVTQAATIVAGDGQCLTSGDGGPATSAGIDGVDDVAIGPDGNLFIAESYYRIRKVNLTSGIISTYAGNGQHGYPNDGDGNGGPAVDASIGIPDAIAVDPSGNLYIADANATIHEVNAQTGIINYVAGNGVFGFSGDGGPATGAEINEPYGVAANSSGIYISDTLNARIREVYR